LLDSEERAMPTDDTPSKPGKRLALFLDGTWNTVSSNTNVWRAKSMCAKASGDGVPQAVYYDKGLGTTMGEIVRGGVFGYGIDDAVIDAYEWLIETFDDGDEIFIFGFSRGATRQGAYPVWCLAVGCYEQARRSRSASSTSATKKVTTSYRYMSCLQKLRPRASRSKNVGCDGILGQSLSSLQAFGTPLAHWPAQPTFPSLREATMIFLMSR
jgi:uncharacterized protein (DUF2235 family)